MKDSILEKALLQAKVLEEAIKTNAKGILADTMKQEINSLVKESLEDEMSSDEETDIAEQNPFAGEDDSDDEQDVDSAEEDNADSDDEDSDEDEMSDDEESDDSDLPDDDFSELPTADDDSDTDFDDDDSDEDDDTIDMTGASDDEVLRIFKKMGEDDGIIVKKEDNGDVELTVNDEEFLVKLNEDEELEDELDEEDEFDGETEMEEQEEVEEGDEDEMCEEDDEPLYEIVFDDEEDFGLGSHADFDGGSEFDNDDDVIDLTGGEEPIDDVPSHGFNLDEPSDIPSHDDFSIEDDSVIDDDGLDSEAEFMEIARTKGLGARPNSLPKGAKAATKVSREALAEQKELKRQNKILKEKVEEYKKALSLFRDKLNEVAVFNANLAYATRLFTEHSTTKQEKMEILKRFDATSTLKESQSLYKTIKSEMNSKASISENVANKIVKTPTNGSSANSKEILAESKAYTSPQFARMKDLFTKLK
jgi:hypothetical protein